jgi:hypothetical protein
MVDAYKQTEFTIPSIKGGVLGMVMVTKKNRADLDLDFGTAST